MSHITKNGLIISPKKRKILLNLLYIIRYEISQMMEKNVIIGESNAKLKASEYTRMQFV